MEINQTEIMKIVISSGKMIMYGAIVLGIVIVVMYLVREKRRRKWIVRLYEMKADGKLHLMGFDKIIKVYYRGANALYQSRKRKNYVYPPIDEAVQRIGGKEYIDYLGYKQEFFPINPSEKSTQIYLKRVNDLIYGKTAQEVLIESKQQTTFIPLLKDIDYSEIIKLKPIEYDMNIMRMNIEETAEKIYAQKQSLIAQYAPFILFGLCAIILLVTIYLTYDYSAKFAQAFEKTDTLFGQLLTKIG